jgi:hypothetical protein
MASRFWSRLGSSPLRAEVAERAAYITKAAAAIFLIREHLVEVSVVRPPARPPARPPPPPPSHPKTNRLGPYPAPPAALPRPHPHAASCSASSPLRSAWAQA